MTKFQSISVNDVYRLNQNGKAAALLDVRSPGEFSEVHAAIAKNIPLTEIQPDTLQRSGFHSDQPVYVICRSGARSRQACELLSASGFEQVFNVEGGTCAWEAQGLPVKRGE